jgi:hypothetical protein
VIENRIEISCLTNARPAQEPLKRGAGRFDEENSHTHRTFAQRSRRSASAST